ncbi:MAG: hypothetical protein QOF51_3814 [Chloroflexota bacterium]|jgi:ubiquinone/menaquinone biosynthesis C-methylase UbiE|nr:hypothetical protein [Chloroflexota bacterium]
MTALPDPEAFRSFEQIGWGTAADAYAAHWGALTQQAVEPLLDAAGVTNGTRALDLATGPGWIAMAAARRGAQVTGVDLAPGMVARASQHAPEIEFRQGDAQDLPFEAESFDAVVMGFGLLHLGHPERALAEAFRVLRPGGRAAFTVWAPAEDAVAFRIVLAAVEAHGAPVALPVGPPFFRFSDHAELSRALTEAGFASPTVTRIPQTWRLPAPEALYEAMHDGTVRTAGLLRGQAPTAQDAIREAVTTGARAYATADGVALPMPAVLGSGTKP